MLIPLHSEVVESNMVLGQEGPSVLYRKWARKQAVHKERPCPPSLGSCWKVLCHPGLQPPSVSEKTGIKFQRKQESHMRKSLPALKSSHKSSESLVFPSPMPKQTHQCVLKLPTSTPPFSGTE